ncbi:MAG: uroporphyrinogen-III synthase [Deltaproteobacteria bacterium]
MSPKSSKTNQRLPLKGRTILVTQAREQAKRFTNLLKQKGARVLACPTVDTIPCATPKTLQCLKQLETYEWLVFVSPNAVIFFFQLLSKHGISKAQLRRLRIVALGKTTREVLKQNKLRVHLVPPGHPDSGAETHLVALFKGKIDGKKILVLKSLDAKPPLLDILRSKGALVDALPLYKSILPAENSKILLKYLSEERIDAVTFTSPSTVHNFIKMLNADHHLMKHLEM